MSEQALNILKFALLGLIYLFFARVLWAVWSEVRTPRARQVVQPGQRTGPGVAGAQQRAAAHAATVPQQRPAAPPAPQAQRRPKKGKKGRAGRLVVLEPRHRRGMAIALGGGEITLGRDEQCTISITDDGYVSQLHLRIYDYDGQPMVEDLGSTNGTFHNGNKLVGSRVLSVGDRIQVGTTVIEAQ